MIPENEMQEAPTNFTQTANRPRRSEGDSGEEEKEAIICTNSFQA
jgi:hypothetical protein